MLVVQGQQDEAHAILGQDSEPLLKPGGVTDYSGRTFRKITAYEYAYWAKDTHMCRKLERHMDDETKVQMLARIDEIERIDAATGQPVGLVYSQGGLEHRCAHFNLTPLISALQRYVDGFNAWIATRNWDAMKATWIEVGILQRDLPVHVVNEYCRPDRSFAPRPEFNEETLPRGVRFYNYNTVGGQALFPLVVSETSGPGIDFAFVRGGLRAGCCWASTVRGWRPVAMYGLIWRPLAA